MVLVRWLLFLSPPPSRTPQVVASQQQTAASSTGSAQQQASDAGDTAEHPSAKRRPRPIVWDEPSCKHPPVICPVLRFFSSLISPLSLSLPPPASSSVAAPPPRGGAVRKIQRRGRAAQRGESHDLHGNKSHDMHGNKSHDLHGNQSHDLHGNQSHDHIATRNVVTLPA